MNTYSFNKRKYLKIIIAISLSLVFIFSGCLSSNNEVDEPFYKNDISELTVILHAGGGIDGLSYMNAQETFLYYYNMGYRYFEYDLKLSSDGRLIGTHAGENIDTSEFSSFSDLTYEQFKEIRLSNGYTPVNEEWLMDTIMTYPDIRIVVDAKGDTIEEDSLIDQRFEELEKIYNYDLSINIIPEVFSVEMWDTLKDTTTYDKYLFSHYKVYYTVDTMLDYFKDDRIWGVALPIWSDSDIRSEIYKLKQSSKKIFVFTAYNIDDVFDIINIGGDGLYMDDPSILKVD